MLIGVASVIVLCSWQFFTPRGQMCAFISTTRVIGIVDSAHFGICISVDSIPSRKHTDDFFQINFLYEN